MCWLVQETKRERWTYKPWTLEYLLEVFLLHQDNSVNIKNPAFAVDD